jgi:hypothetical protein
MSERKACLKSLRARGWLAMTIPVMSAFSGKFN